ncbi:MAG: hypothetical protein C6Y22_04865 [Hapalosiphonaceae cyanobacterium JJU2]|nr:MAG: hypothetical protein C6Y22_04865 [Hapalosiphonaceae cyanobacterium JJU2]
MFKTTQIVTTPSVECLLKLWVRRYIPDLSSLSLSQEILLASLTEAVSPEGRAQTVARLKNNLLDIDSQMAWLQTKSLHNYIPNVLDFNEAKQITDSALIVYKVLLDFYQKQASNTTALITNLSPTFLNLEEIFLAEFGISAIKELTSTLEPTLIAFQEQHMACKDWRTLGFMTTQLKFTNKFILNQITPIEKVLISPYINFIEEQVAIPWQRVCVASAKHDLDSPIFNIVEQMLPLAEDIAHTVYHKLVKIFPSHCSRSGSLNSPIVAQSSIRDLNMFQAYLWLCVLEESLIPVEQELVDLCVMVMEKLEVKWEILQQWNQILMDEIIHRVKPEYQNVLSPYTQGMILAFDR